MVMVTISASYGAGGSAVAPRVAERLGLPFVDRAIPVAVANDLGVSTDEADELYRNVSGRWPRFLAAMTSLSYDFAMPIVQEVTAEGSDLAKCTDDHLHRLAGEGGAVVLGHAAALVLAGRPDALHVRLDGPPEARVAAAMRQHGIDHDAAQTAMRENDKLRTGYVTHFYQADAADPSLYDLVIDSTRLDWGQVEDVIVYATGLGDRAAVEE